MIIYDSTLPLYPCPHCGALVEIGAMHWCYVGPRARGWECPRCRAIHAPWVSRCDCPAPTVVSSTIRLEPTP